MNHKEIIAVLLYKLGFKPKATLYIDEQTVMFGYGKCYEVGRFKYNLPHKIANKLRKRL